MHGFAHLFEHMMFQGSKNVAKDHHIKYIQSIGGEVNAVTNQDKTSYYNIIPINNLEYIFWLESDRMFNLIIDKDHFINQKEIVIEEIKQCFDNKPYGSAIPELYKYSFIKHPYNWYPFGNYEHIKKVKIIDAKHFYKKFYQPSNAVLSIVGDIDIIESKEMINKYFNEVKPSEKFTREKYECKYNLGEIQKVIQDNIKIPAIYIGYKIPPISSKDTYAFDLLSIILSKGNSSVLYKNIVYKNKTASAITAYNTNFELGGLFTVSAYTASVNNLKKLVNEIEYEIYNLINNPMNDRELIKAKNAYETKFIERLENMIGKAVLMASYFTFFKDTNTINRTINNILNISMKDIVYVINKYLVKENRVVLYFIPKNNSFTL